MLRLVVLVDNEPGAGLKSDWGWSVYLDDGSHRVLFDADTSPSVLEFNASRLGVDLKGLDFAVLSHHHFDHYGGFEAVGRASPGLRVYVPPGPVERLARWGLEPIVVREAAELVDGFWVSGPVHSGGWGLYEQALGVCLEGLGLVVVVGCSHPGADVLAEEVLEHSGCGGVFWVLGGYHSPGKSVLDRLASMSRYLSPAHCSGSWAKSYVAKTYPEKYVPLRTGSIIVVEAGGRLVIK